MKQYLYKEDRDGDSIVLEFETASELANYLTKALAEDEFDTEHPPPGLDEHLEKAKDTFEQTEDSGRLSDILVWLGTEYVAQYRDIAVASFEEVCDGEYDFAKNLIEGFCEESGEKVSEIDEDLQPDFIEYLESRVEYWV